MRSVLNGVGLQDRTSVRTFVGASTGTGLVARELAAVDDGVAAYVLNHLPDPGIRGTFALRPDRHLRRACGCRELCHGL